MAWRRPGDKPLSELMMVSLTTHICITRPQWVKKISLSWSYQAGLSHIAVFILYCHISNIYQISQLKSTQGLSSRFVFCAFDNITRLFIHPFEKWSYYAMMICTRMSFRLSIIRPFQFCRLFFNAFWDINLKLGIYLWYVCVSCGMCLLTPIDFCLIVHMLFVPRPFWRKIGGLWNCLHPFVRSSLRPPVIWTKLCGHHNSATTWPIHSKSSSLEPSWLVDVQHNAHLPIRPLEGIHWSWQMGVLGSLWLPVLKTLLLIW